MGYFDNKKSMEVRALLHTEDMKNRYEKETVLSASLSTIYYEAFNPALVEGTPKRIEVIDAGSVEAAFNEYNCGMQNGKNVKPCILNFASYKNPGGMFLAGSSAQEECLCHASNLYNILEKFNKDYYIPHRQKGATNRALYSNQAIYSPDVVFEYEKNTFKCDVLTCAAPNFSAAHRYYGVTSKKNAEVLFDRITFLRKILENNHVDTVILGAYGCGVFGQDPNLVASYMNQIFKDSNIDTIVYAIPRGLNEKNYLAFERRIEQV